MVVVVGAPLTADTKRRREREKRGKTERRGGGKKRRGMAGGPHCHVAFKSAKPLPCGVHGFTSWITKDSWFCCSIVEMKLWR
jgi:hypothetical protein